MEVRNVCEKLDETAIKYFEILEDLTERQKRLQDGLREGFLNLSKARYSMGSRSVGSLQYNGTNMRALASVQVSEECGTSTFCTQRRNPTKKITQQIQEGCGDQGESLDVQSTETQEIQSTETQVRRRKVGTKGAEISSLEDRIQELSVKEEDNDSYHDPLRWFGILVPAALRQGQTVFIEAVDHCTEIASLQNRLMAVQLEYEELRKAKAELREASESRGTEDSKASSDIGR